MTGGIRDVRVGTPYETGVGTFVTFRIEAGLMQLDHGMAVMEARRLATSAGWRVVDVAQATWRPDESWFVDLQVVR